MLVKDRKEDKFREIHSLALSPFLLSNAMWMPVKVSRRSPACGDVALVHYPAFP